jgi:hypothetical protein
VIIGVDEMAHQILEHECFDEMVEETGSDATFEKVMHFDFDKGKVSMNWVINLFRYTPALNISSTRGKFIPNFCPMCGKDFRSNHDG